MSEHLGTRAVGGGDRHTWTQAAAVAAGGAAGAVARWAVSIALPDDPLEVGTVVVNLLGALLLGALVSRPMGERAGLFWRTGFLGAFTTFSAMSADAASLGPWGAIYLLLLVGAGLAAARLGLRAGRGPRGRRSVGERRAP